MEIVDLLSKQSLVCYFLWVIEKENFTKARGYVIYKTCRSVLFTGLGPEYWLHLIKWASLLLSKVRVIQQTIEAVIPWGLQFNQKFRIQTKVGPVYHKPIQSYNSNSLVTVILILFPFHLDKSLRFWITSK